MGPCKSGRHDPARVRWPLRATTEAAESAERGVRRFLFSLILTNDVLVVQIRSEEGVLVRSRLRQLSWRKLSEWPPGQAQP